MKLSMPNMEAFSSITDQFEVAKSYYQRLSDRERYIVLGFGILGYLLLLFLIYMLLSSSVSGVAKKIATSKKNQSDMSALADRMKKSKNTVNSIERVIRRTEVGFQLATELERIASKHEVKIDALKDRPGQPNELYKEMQSTIKLSGVDIKTLIKFLFDIEQSPKLMRVSSLQIKPNFKDTSKLNVSFVVSTFQSKKS